MRLHSWFRLALVAGLAVSLPACSYFSGLFPDKQKQYRYSTELPDLEVPPDLLGSQIGGKDSYAETDSPTATETPATAPAKKRKAGKHLDQSVILAESSDDNAALIELTEAYPAAWNDVSRALGRLKVEITDQNQTDGVFYVYYGGQPPKKPEETGFWDDVKSVFHVESDQAKEYRVKLIDKDVATLIKVLDEDGKGVSEGPGLELLKRIHKKLTTLNQPEPEGEEGRAERQETEKPADEKQ